MHHKLRPQLLEGGYGRLAGAFYGLSGFGRALRPLLTSSTSFVFQFRAETAPARQEVVHHGVLDTFNHRHENAHRYRVCDLNEGASAGWRARGCQSGGVQSIESDHLLHHHVRL